MADYTLNATSPVSQGSSSTLSIGDPSNQLLSNGPDLTFDDGGAGGLFDDGTGGAAGPVTISGVSGPMSLAYTPAATSMVSVNSGGALVDPPPVQVVVTAGAKPRRQRAVSLGTGIGM